MPWALVFSKGNEESEHRRLSLAQAPGDMVRDLGSSLLLEGKKWRGEKAFWNLPWSSAFETGRKPKKIQNRVFNLQKGLVQGEGEPRERKEPLQTQTHLLFQLPGLLSPEQHLVPGLLVGVRHQRVSVVRPQLWEEQLSGRAGPGAGPGNVWGRAGADRARGAPAL